MARRGSLRERLLVASLVAGWLVLSMLGGAAVLALKQIETLIAG